MSVDPLRTSVNLNQPMTASVEYGVDFAVKVASMNMIDALNSGLKNEVKNLESKNSTLRSLVDMSTKTQKLLNLLPTGNPNARGADLSKKPYEPKIDLTKPRYAYLIDAKIGASQWFNELRPDLGQPLAVSMEPKVYDSPFLRYQTLEAELKDAAAKMGYSVKTSNYGEVQTLYQSLEGFLKIENGAQSTSMTSVQGLRDNINTQIQTMASSQQAGNRTSHAVS